MMVGATKHTLTDQKRINWLLKSLKSQHQLLRLSLDGTELTERSMVVSVSSDMSCFLLDAATDSVIHDKISQGQLFSLETTHDGIDVRAEGIKSVETLDDEQGKLYKIPFPSQLLYFQQRDAFRVSLSGLFTVPVSLTLSESSEQCLETSAECSLSNLSAKGCLLSVAGVDETFVMDPESALTLRFELPEATDVLSLEARLCHSRHLKRSALWLIGFEFQNLTAATQNTLERYVVKLQLLARQKSLLSD